MNNCHFCNKKIRISSYGLLTNDWFICDFCNVTYQYDDSILKIIRFKTILNDEKYCLDLMLKESTSEVIHIPFNTNKPVTVILHLPFLVQGINPSNCQDKIKTYIMFS